MSLEENRINPNHPGVALAKQLIDEIIAAHSDVNTWLLRDAVQALKDIVEDRINRTNDLRLSQTRADDFARETPTLKAIGRR